MKKQTYKQDANNKNKIELNNKISKVIENGISKNNNVLKFNNQYNNDIEDIKGFYNIIIKYFNNIYIDKKNAIFLNGVSNSGKSTFIKDVINYNDNDLNNLNKMRIIKINFNNYILCENLLQTLTKDFIYKINSIKKVYSDFQVNESNIIDIVSYFKEIPFKDNFSDIYNTIETSLYENRSALDIKINNFIRSFENYITDEKIVFIIHNIKFFKNYNEIITLFCCFFFKIKKILFILSIDINQIESSSVNKFRNKINEYGHLININNVITLNLNINSKINNLENLMIKIIYNLYNLPIGFLSISLNQLETKKLIKTTDLDLKIFIRGLFIHLLFMKRNHIKDYEKIIFVLKHLKKLINSKNNQKTINDLYQLKSYQKILLPKWFIVIFFETKNYFLNLNKNFEIKNNLNYKTNFKELDIYNLNLFNVVEFLKKNYKFNFEFKDFDLKKVISFFLETIFI